MTCLFTLIDYFSTMTYRYGEKQGIIQEFTLVCLCDREKLLLENSVTYSLEY